MIVTTPAALVSALKACAAYCVITLAPGAWHAVNIDSVDKVATINGPGAVLHDLNVTRSSGLTFSGLNFDATGFPMASWGPQDAFAVKLSNHIAFDHDHFYGNPYQTVTNSASGLDLFYDDTVSVTTARSRRSTMPSITRKPIT